VVYSHELADPDLTHACTAVRAIASPRMLVTQDGEVGKIQWNEAVVLRIVFLVYCTYRDEIPCLTPLVGFPGFEALGKYLVCRICLCACAYRVLRSVTSQNVEKIARA
jgi:hypothetical protein